MPLLKVPEKWDDEADVVVVGAGNAGLPAAITVTDKGAKVIVLETWGAPASSLAYMGGGGFFAGTDLQKEQGIDDSPDKFFEEVIRKTEGSPELWRVVADRQLEAYEWLKKIGVKPVTVFLAPGHDVTRIVRFEGHGPRLFKILRKTAEQKGIEILCKHRGERLIVDPATGRVVGIRARHNDKALDFKAKKAVILATGGYIMNRDMVKEYGPYSVGCLSKSAPAHYGDGLKMALDVGAATADIGASASPSLSTCVHTGQTTVMFNEGAIVINPDGERWADEMGRPYNMMFKEHMEKYPDGLHFLVYDSRIREVASSYAKLKEYSADTIEELAKAVGLDPKALKATIDEFNSDIDKYGYDKKFGRKVWGGLKGEERVPKIDTPPYYALKCKVALTSCKGGVKINTKAQVIDLYGDVVPGLYAAGEVSGGFFSKPDAYFAGGMSTVGFVFGIIAGENAVAEVSH